MGLRPWRNVADDFNFASASVPTLVPEQSSKELACELSVHLKSDGQRALRKVVVEMVDVATRSHTHHDAILADPHHLRANGISDHSPWSATFGMRPSLPP